MAVTFVLGRAGTGKTHYCLEALRAELSGAETRPLLVLVPEQASFQTERALVDRAPGGAFWRAEVLSFSRLAQRVIRAAGDEPLLLERGARELALRTILTRDPALAGMFRSSARAAGFHATLERLIEELLHENVQPAALAQAAGRLLDAHSRAKVGQLAQIYAAYLDWLGAERVDPAQRLALLRQRAGAADFLVGARVWVDGFAGFTGQEMETLAVLARKADALTITLLLDPEAESVPGFAPHGDGPATDDPLRLFSRTERTYQRLLRGFAAEGVRVNAPVKLPTIGGGRGAPVRFAASPQLARLEQALATVATAAREPAPDSETPPAVRILRCATPADELRQAARHIRRSVQEAGGALRWSDFAVIARDLEPLATQAAEIFDEYGIPVFVDRRRSMRVHPLGRLVQAVFEVVLSDFSVAATTRLLRTGLLDLPDGYAERLENTIIQEQVRGLGLWRRADWDFAATPEPPASAPPGAGTPASILRRDGTRPPEPRLRVLTALTPLIEAASRTPPPSGADWARLVFDVLERLSIARRISSWIDAARAAQREEAAQLHRLAWAALVGVLEDMDGILSDCPLEAREAAALLGGALGSVSIGLAPPTLDQVLISAIERSRHPEIKHAWIIGVNDGNFPARPGEDPLLTHDERAGLLAAGLPAPVPRREELSGERLLAYIACTRPSVGLTISFAAAGADGAPLAPSPLIAMLRELLPEVTIAAPEANPPPLTLMEFARDYLSNRTAAPGAGPTSARRRLDRLRGVLATTPALQSRAETLLAGEKYRNRALAVPELASLARSRGAPTGAGAPEVAVTLSQLESHLRCPFRFYSEHALRIGGPVSASADAAELGALAHTILADVTAAAIAEPGGAAHIAEPRWRALLDSATERAVRQRPAELARRRPQLTFLMNRLLALLPDVVLAHAARWRRGEFRPALVEQSFGDANNARSLPAPLVELADGRRVALSGRIDRVDDCRVGGRRAVIAYDYKSWPQKLTNREIATAVWLQLFTYMLALRALEPAVQPAGVFVAPLRANLKAAGRAAAASDDPAALAQEQRMRMLLPRGLIDAALVPQLDASWIATGDSPVASVRRNRDGEFAQNSDARPARRLAQWLALTEATVRLVGDGIARGDVSVAPLVEGRTLACATCELRPLCRFDRQVNHARDALAVLPRLSREDGPAPADSEGSGA